MRRLDGSSALRWNEQIGKAANSVKIHEQGTVLKAPRKASRRDGLMRSQPATTVAVMNEQAEGETDSYAVSKMRQSAFAHYRHSTNLTGKKAEPAAPLGAANPTGYLQEEIVRLPLVASSAKRNGQGRR